MATERLLSLEVSPFRFHLLTEREFRLPAYKGAIFRGGFGQIFRDLSCITHAPTCDGCAHAAQCGYSRVFESPILPGEANILTKYTNAPHPFVISPPLDARTYLPAGSRIHLDVVLIGPARAFFPQFLFAFDRMGSEGRYGGPYRVERVTSGVDGRLLFDGRIRKILSDPPPVGWGDGVPARRIRLEFLTPLRMRTEGRYNSNPDFVAFAHALLGRLHLLTAIYGGQAADRGWMREFLRLADEVKTVGRRWELFEWERTSGRQGRRIEMDGVVGSLTAEGELGPFLPVLRAGEWVQVGSGTSLGLGKFRVVIEE